MFADSIHAEEAIAALEEFAWFIHRELFSASRKKVTK